MAQKSNNKRAERREKSERNMNRAVILLTAGIVAEWYLLLVDRSYARGNIDQFVRWYDILGVMRWVGFALLAAGVVLYALRKERRWFSWLGAGLSGVGVFFAFTSICMRHVYPTSVTVMCVLVPVVLILGIVYLFYQVEFSVQATALAMALGALALLGRSQSRLVKACAVLALLGVAALLACVFLLKKRNGALKLGDKRLRLFAPEMDYRVTLGVLALCLVLLLVTMIAPGAAFYTTWGLAIVAFGLAVYYTVKLL